MSADLAKINAAAAALNYVKDGMTLGLGTGSTAAHFVRLLGERVRQGLKVRGTPTSEATKKLAEEAGLPIVFHVGGGAGPTTRPTAIAGYYVQHGMARVVSGA